MRVEQVNFTSRNRVARAWSIKDRVSNSSGERKKERKKKDKNVIRKDIKSMLESSIDDFGTEI